MKIYVDLANPAAKVSYAGYLSAFRQLADHDKWGNHSLVYSPETADCILFIDAHVSLSVDYYRVVDNHPLTQRFPDKVLVYDEYDRPPSYGRGIYVSLPKHLFKAYRHSIVCYWLNTFDTFDSIQVDTPRTEYCFFAGAVSYNPTRARIVKQLAGSVVNIKDTSAISPWKTGMDAPTQDDLAQSRREYAAMMLKHQYCVAPLGKGVSSYRMFEAFLHGTVPIVMSDEYVAPDIDGWHECIVTIQQRRPRDVLLLQQQLQSEFILRQRKLHQIQSDYFALDSRWNFFGNQIERVMNHDSRWQTRSRLDEAKTKLYWFKHRMIKLVEGRFV